eukprot:GHVU01199934.1.p1 GENE.GHVU01199934.1~~GHVU01199934.1.p1  ORF type:complete len:296 (-),score=16.20 GHVU01199934.1:882-1769(-)
MHARMPGHVPCRKGPFFFRACRLDAVVVHASSQSFGSCCATIPQGHALHDVGFCSKDCKDGSCKFPEGFLKVMEMLFVCPAAQPHAYISSISEEESAKWTESSERLGAHKISCCTRNEKCKNRPPGSLEHCCDRGLHSIDCPSHVCLNHPFVRGGKSTKAYEDIIATARRLAETEKDKTPSPCPADHPFPYQGGGYCCVAPFDCSNRTMTDSNADCCYNHLYVKCPRVPCLALDQHMKDMYRTLTEELAEMANRFNPVSLVKGIEAFAEAMEDGLDDPVELASEGPPLPQKVAGG